MTAALPVAWTDLWLLVFCPVVAGAVALLAAWIGSRTMLGGRRLGVTLGRR